MNDLELTLPTMQLSKGIVDADSIMFYLGWYFDAIDVSPEPVYPAPEFVQVECGKFHRKLLEEMGVDQITYHFTGSGRNRHLIPDAPAMLQFRTIEAIQQATGYKENRDFNNTPTGYGAVLLTFLNDYNSTIHFDVEADDAVVALKKEHPSWVLASNDKDVYMQVVGKHYNYDKRKAWVTTDVATANRFPYLQAITGDPVDGFKGATRKGVAWVNKNMPLHADHTPKQMWDIVIRAFVEAKHANPLQEAVFNMRMANMHQYVDGKIRIFSPPTDETMHVFSNG